MRTYRTDARKSQSEVWQKLPDPLKLPSAVAASFALTAVATLCGMVMLRWLPAAGVSLIYLLAIVLGAVGFGVAAGVASAVLSFLAYNFFFITPTYTFTISDPRELFALFVFFGVAVMTGSLAGRLREAAGRAQSRAASLQSLNAFAAELSRASTEQSVMNALAAQASELRASGAIVLMQAGEELTPVAEFPAGQILETPDWQAAKRCLRHAQPAYPSAPGWPGSRYEFHPIEAAKTVIGVLALAPAEITRRSREDDSALHTMLQHTAIAIERTRLETESMAARSEAERERLRSALLSSLSHDLKTPLASILGSVTALREVGIDLSEHTRADLLLAIEEETTRLTQFVTNLLDMTRLETEVPDLRRDWLDAGDAIHGSVGRARRLYPHANIDLECGLQVPLVRGDAVLFDHVVFNLIDNAVKFSHPDGRLHVSLKRDGAWIILKVTDDGPGISAGELQHVFDKFYRGGSRDGCLQGTGLGLTICKRIAEGMGGRVEAQSPIARGRGTAMIVRLPIPEQEPVVSDPSAAVALAQ